MRNVVIETMSKGYRNENDLTTSRSFRRRLDILFSSWFGQPQEGYGCEQFVSSYDPDLNIVLNYMILCSVITYLCGAGIAR